MKTLLWLLACWSVAITIPATLGESPAPIPSAAKAISVADLVQNARAITGLLGIPLGTLVDIEGSIVSGRDLRLGANREREFLLSVEKVNGVSLAKTQVMMFSAPFRDVKLPN
jgi:hypothetical protein